ncbi:hypothetical protein [Burkholderia sp. Bp8963]|uniref:hypothetical protein n=1 Tax=Burkholderia sp. Bp8963 TaxID=2184547 RepID=UPI00163A3AC1|nr:hypothetical protein [Burkholderia sp. Bp8963]
MTERDYEIGDLAKEILGRIVQGNLSAGATVDVEQSAELAVRCATALIDKLEERAG